jgi:hypothetical protein
MMLRRTAMIATTTSSSIRVNEEWSFFFMSILSSQRCERK